MFLNLTSKLDIFQYHIPFCTASLRQHKQSNRRLRLHDFRGGKFNNYFELLFSENNGYLLVFCSHCDLNFWEIYTTQQMSSRPALGPTQPPIQWVPGFLSPGVKRTGREADHSLPTSAILCNDVKSYNTNHATRHSVWEFRVVVISAFFTLTSCMAGPSTLQMKAKSSSKMNLGFEVLTAVVFWDVTLCNALTITGHCSRAV
jgi:hypothetical protein